MKTGRKSPARSASTPRRNPPISLRCGNLSGSFSQVEDANVSDEISA